MRKCKVCKTKYEPVRQMQTTCDSFDCKVAYAEKAAAKSRAKRATEEAKKTRQRLDAMKTIPQLIAEADKAFCAFIRKRDELAGHPCISSGRPLDWNGNNVDAGHYRSRGAASHLRYDEKNCHAQSKHDNRYLGGNIVAYRIGLIARIGQAEVDRIESDNTSHKWTREELQGIIETYKRKLKKLKQ